MKGFLLLFYKTSITLAVNLVKIQYKNVNRNLHLYKYNANITVNRDAKQNIV
jgi:hypothetical protein